jgi:hypothetical protein
MRDSPACISQFPLADNAGIDLQDWISTLHPFLVLEQACSSFGFLYNRSIRRATPSFRNA